MSRSDDSFSVHDVGMLILDAAQVLAAGEHVGVGGVALGGGAGGQWQVA